MMPSDRPKVFVHLLPSLIPPGSLRGGVAVVVDVLRATSVMVHALAAGCEAIIPCAEIDEAQAIARGLPRGSVLLAGERGGLPIPGFDLGNSPGDFTRKVCEGKTLVMTTTNGTRAILACLEAERVYIASFANLRAISDELAIHSHKKDHGDPVHIVCSGTEGYISLEDSLLAGAIATNLTEVTIQNLGTTSPMGNDEAWIAVSQWLGVAPAFRERPLDVLLKLGRGGQNVQRIGLAADIATAAQMDRFPLIAELSRNPLRIVKV
ncbi:MAG: 2-phosphosulfolactate phosphatase [Isosphaeraceae bacterium]